MVPGELLLEREEWSEAQERAEWSLARGRKALSLPSIRPQRRLLRRRWLRPRLASIRAVRPGSSWAPAAGLAMALAAGKQRRCQRASAALLARREEPERGASWIGQLGWVLRVSPVSPARQPRSARPSWGEAPRGRQAASRREAPACRQGSVGRSGRPGRAPRKCRTDGPVVARMEKAGAPARRLEAQVLRVRAPPPLAWARTE
jgi:hypothetical protein